MARGNSQQYQSYDHHHASSERGPNHLSSPQNRHDPVYYERNYARTHTDLIAVPNGAHTLPPGQHTELRISRAPPLPQMEESSYYSRDVDSSYAYLVSNRAVEASQQQVWPGRPADEIVSLASTQKQTTHFGCYSIPELRAMGSPAARRLHEGVFLHGQKNTFSSCLYPKPVKIKLNMRAVEKPPEHMEASEFARPNRNIRVSLMSSFDSPEQISLKLLHALEVPETEPEPENIQMPFELMPSPRPPDELVEVKLLPVGDSHQAHMQEHCHSGLAVSGVLMRRLGIGAFVGLEMAHQFAIYSLRVLNSGLHIYGPIVTKAAVSSYEGLRRGCKVFLHKSAPIANHAKGVTLACMRKTGKGCAQVMKKQNIASCIACLSLENDSEDEMDECEHAQHPGADRPSYYDSELAWKESLRVYPEPKEEPEVQVPDSDVNCSSRGEPVDAMGENPRDGLTPEVLSIFEDCSSDEERDATQQDSSRQSRLSARNFDGMRSIVPFHVEANRRYYRDPMTTCRRSLLLSPLRNKPRGDHGGHSLGALVWPPTDVRTFADPLRDHLAARLAIRPEPKNYRDLIQKPPREEECIWRSTLRAYFKEQRAKVRPEDVLLCRRAIPMKLMSREETERHEEDHLVSGKCARRPHDLESYPYNKSGTQSELAEFSACTDSKRRSHDQHLKQRPPLQISHGDRIVHHCVTKKKPPSYKLLPNRGKDKTQYGHSSFPRLKHQDECASLAKHDDEQFMRNEGSHIAISSIHSRMEDGDFWQTNPIHSSESDWKVLPVSQPPHHGQKRQHSPEPSTEEVFRSSVSQAVEQADKSSQADHPAGKHQKLEVMSAPDSLMKAKFSERPLRISKHELSSDRAIVGSPAESGLTGKSLKNPKSPQSPQPLTHVGDEIAHSFIVRSKVKPFRSSPKSSQTPRKYSLDRDARPAYIPSNDQQLHDLPSSPPKSFNEHHNSFEFGLKSPFSCSKSSQTPRKYFLDRDARPGWHLHSVTNSRCQSFEHLHPTGKSRFQFSEEGRRRIHPYPSDKCHDRFSRIPRKEVRGPSYVSSVGRHSAEEFRRTRISRKRDRSSSPVRSYTPNLDSKGKSGFSLFKAGLSFLRPYSLSPQILRRKSVKKDAQSQLLPKSAFWYPQFLRKQSAKDDHTGHLPKSKSSLWSLSSQAKLTFSIFTKNRPGSRPHSPGTPPRRTIKTLCTQSTLSQISDDKKRAERQLPLESPDPRNLGKIRTTHDHVPRVKIFLSKKDPYGIRSQQHGIVPRKSVDIKKKTPKTSFSSACGSKRATAKKTKTDSKLKNRKKDQTQQSSRSDFSFPYLKRAAAMKEDVSGNVRGISRSRKVTSDSQTPSGPGKPSKWPNTHGGVARSGSSRWNHGDRLPLASRSPSKLRRKMQKYEYPTKSHLHRYEYSGTHIDSLWASKFLTPEITHMVRSLHPDHNRAGTKSSHPQKKHQDQIRSTMDREPTSKPQTVDEQSVDNNRGGIISSHPQKKHEDPTSTMDREPASKLKPDHDDGATLNGYAENLTSAPVTVSPVHDKFKFHHVGNTRETSASTTGDTPSLNAAPQSSEIVIDRGTVAHSFVESDQFLVNCNRDTINETSTNLGTNHSGNFASSGSTCLPSSEPSHREPTRPTVEVVQFPSSVVFPGYESDAEASDEVCSSGIRYQQNPDISNLLKAYQEALIKEVESPYTGVVETESTVQDSGTILTRKTVAARHSSNFIDHKLPHPPELSLDIKKCTPESSSIETSNFGVTCSTSEIRHALPALDSLEEAVVSLQFSNQQKRVKTSNLDAVYDPTSESHAPPSLDSFKEGVGSFELNNQSKRDVDHVGEGEINNVLESRHSEVLVQLDQHRQEDETHFPSLAESSHSSVDNLNALDASGHSVKSAGPFQLEHQQEHVSQQQDLEDDTKEHQDKNPLASVPVGQLLSLDTDLLQLIHQVSAESPDPSKPRQFEVEIPTVEEVTIEHSDTEQEGEGQASVIAESHVEGQSVYILEDTEYKTPSGSENQTSSHLPISNILDESYPLLDALIPVEKEESLHRQELQAERHEVRFVAEEQGGSWPSPKQHHDGVIVEHQSGEFVSSELQRKFDSLSISYAIDSSKTDGPGGTLQSTHHQKLVGEVEFMGHLQEDEGQKSFKVFQPEGPLHAIGRDGPYKDQIQDEGGQSSLTSPQLSQYRFKTLQQEVVNEQRDSAHMKEVDGERLPHEKDAMRQIEFNYLDQRLVGDYSEIGEHNYESSISSHDVNRRGLNQEGLGIQNDWEKVGAEDMPHHELKPVISGCVEEDGHSSVSPESQRSNTESHNTLAMIDQNFPELKFSEKLAAWETVSRNYVPPAQQQGAFDDMSTVVLIASKQDQSSSESRQVTGLDLGTSSKQQFTSKHSLVNYQDSIAHLERDTQTHELILDSRLVFAAAPRTGSKISVEGQISRPSSREDVALRGDDYEHITQSLPTEKFSSARNVPSITNEGSALESQFSDNAVAKKFNSQSNTDNINAYVQRRMSSDHRVDERLTSNINLYLQRRRSSDTDGSLTAEYVHSFSNISLDSVTINQGKQQSTLHSQGQADTSDNQGHVKIEDFKFEDAKRLENQPSWLKTKADEEKSHDDYAGYSKKWLSMDDSQLESRSARLNEVGSEILASYYDNAGYSKKRPSKDDSQLGLSSSRSADWNEMGLEMLSFHSQKRLTGSDKLNLLEKRNAWKLVSTVGKDLYHETESRRIPVILDEEDDDVNSEPISGGDAKLEKTTENHFSPLLQSGTSVSAQSLSESYETASEQGFATTTTTSGDSEGVRRSSRSFDGLSSEPGTPSPSPPNWQTSAGNNLLPPPRSRRSVFERPLLKKSSIRTSQNEQTFAAAAAALQSQQEPVSTLPIPADTRNSSSSEGGLNVLKSDEDVVVQSPDNYENPFQPRFSSSPSVSSEGSSDGSLGMEQLARRDPGSRTRGSLFVRPLLKNSLVAASESEQILSQLRSGKNQAQQQPSAGIRDDSSIEQRLNINIRDEGGVRRSSSFQGLPSSVSGSDGGTVERPRSIKSLFVRPALKKSLVASSETEQTFSRLRNEQHGEVDTKDNGEKTGYQSDSSLGGDRSELRSSSPPSRDSQGSSDGSTSVPARSRTRGSLFVRPILKKSLVANTETERVFARLQSEQNEIEDTRSEQEFLTREVGGVGRSANFEGLIGSRFSSPTYPEGADGNAVPTRPLARSRKSLFTRPVLKRSLVANSETARNFARLQSKQNEIEDTRSEQGFGTREGGRSSRSTSFKGLIGSRSSDSPSDSKGSDRISVPGRSRGSLFIRPDLKKSLVGTWEAEANFARLRSEENEVEKDTRRKQRFDNREGTGVSRSASFEGLPGESEGSDRVSVPARSTGGSLFIRPDLKKSLVADSQTERILVRLQSRQNDVEDTSRTQGFDTREGTGIRRSASFESLVGSRSFSTTNSKGSDGNSVPTRPRKSLFTRPVLKKSLVANPETERIFAKLQSEQNETEERLSRPEDTKEPQQSSKDGLESGASPSQISEGRFSPPNLSSRELADEKLPLEPPSRKSFFVHPSLKKSLIRTSDTEHSLAQYESENQEPPTKLVTFNASPEDTSNDSEARSSYGESDD